MSRWLCECCIRWMDICVQSNTHWHKGEKDFETEQQATSIQTVGENMRI